MNTPESIKVVAALPFKSVVISFLVGMLAGVWLALPSPSNDLSNMDMDEIIYNVLDQLEDEGYSISKTKDELIDPSGWNIFHAMDWND
jgi:hypothetical protein